MPALLIGTLRSLGNCGWSHFQSTVMALLEDSSLDKAALVADTIVARVGSGADLHIAQSPGRS